MARAAFLCAGELAKDPDLSDTARSTLRKIWLAVAFSADASFDALQLSSRTMAANFVVRRSVWLCNWEVDAGSQSRLVAVSFQGSKLFG